MKISRKVKAHIVFFLLCAGLAVVAIIYINNRFSPSDYVAQIKDQPHVESAKDTPTPPGGVTGTLSAPTPTPRSFSLKIPFTPQAPTANWDELHNEACEEASAIMAATYFGVIDNGAYQNETNLPAEFVEKEITKITEWEENHFGYHLDINTKETAQMIAEVYGLNTKILTDFTEEDIKEEMYAGRVIIWPANGQMLGNPNFRNQGPPYHVVVLKGFKDSDFITNDPGTRKGLNYPYTYKTLYEANGDFDHATHKVDTSKKMVIVVWK